MSPLTFSPYFQPPMLKPFRNHNFHSSPCHYPLGNSFAVGFPFISLNFFFFYWFQREGKWRRKGGRETSMWERNINQLPLTHTPTGDQTHNPSLCLDQESNLQPFGLWDSTQPTEPHQSGLHLSCLELPNSLNLRVCISNQIF